MTSLETVRTRFTSSQGLPFADVLTEASILEVLEEHHVEYRDRVFGPITTLWGFHSQVLSDDHGCRDAVARVRAHRAASGREPCSPDAAGYCNARARLPTGVLRAPAKRAARQLQDGLPRAWQWNGRDVFIADGSHVAMPDTPQNQAAYPQVYSQGPGVGFPLARLAVLLSLAGGACHDLAVAPYAGKGTGETTLLRQMYGSPGRGAGVVADALFDNSFLIWELRERGVDVVAREQAERVGTVTMERGLDGDLVAWQRPNKPRGMTGEQYRRYPKSQAMRRVRVDARDKDSRVQQFAVVTTLLDTSIGGGQIGGLYERRRAGEVDIRSVKSVMKMDVLRCKSPETVRTGIWAHLLAYDLLRTVMAVAAAASDTEPRKIGFKWAKQAVTAFAPQIEAARPEDRGRLIDALRKTVAYHRVGNRPGRWEPRARKRRPERAARLMQPRAVAKLPQNRERYF
jgi:hypothetical protein